MKVIVAGLCIVLATLSFVVQAEGAEARQEAEVRQLRWFSREELEDMELAFVHGEVVRRYLAEK